MLPEDLHSLKYVELQKLAKSAGVRANQKVEKLISALNDHYAQTKEEEIVDNGQHSLESCTNLSRRSTAGSEKSGNTSRESTSSTEKQSKKRRRTFELEEPTLKGDITPTIGSNQERTRRQTSRNTTPLDETQAQPTKRLRRSTFDKNTPEVKESKSVSKSSPSTRAIIESIQGDCSSAERKEKLLSAIDKKVQLKMVSSPLNPSKTQTSQIPRFMAFLTNKKKENNKPVTPGNKDWNKIHKKAFSKFDSIDVYLEKKHQRIENLTSSSKKQLPNKSTASKTSTKIVKPVPKAPDSKKVFKPTVTSTKNLGFDFSTSSSAKKETNPPKVFKPTVISTKNITFNFSKTTTSESSKTPKSRLANTPSRKGAPTPNKVKHSASTNKGTPFKFTGNTSSLNTTANSAKKPAFDLKASLARPLTWKPHTGKLQTVDFNVGHNNVSTLKPANDRTNLKTRKVMSREAASANRPIQAKNVRRADRLDRRNNQKYVDMMRRRGLMP